MQGGRGECGELCKWVFRVFLSPIHSCSFRVYRAGERAHRRPSAMCAHVDSCWVKWRKKLCEREEKSAGNVSNRTSLSAHTNFPLPRAEKAEKRRKYHQHQNPVSISASVYREFYTRSVGKSEKSLSKTLTNFIRAKILSEFVRSLFQVCEKSLIFVISSTRCHKHLIK